MQLSSLWFSAQFNLSRIPHVFKLKSLHRKVISPFINIDFENDYYQVKTASTADEIIQVLALRFEVFFREFSGNKVEFSLFPYDVDVYDFICDHLIVKDKNSGQVVACYRLLSSKNPKRSGSTTYPRLGRTDSPLHIRRRFSKRHCAMHGKPKGPK
jgi:putative hemolysin